MKKNLILLWIRDALIGISGAFGSASIIRGVLLYSGMSESRIGIYVTFGAVVNFIASLGLSGAASATGKTVKVSSVCYILLGLIGAAACSSHAGNDGGNFSVRLYDDPGLPGDHSADGRRGILYLRDLLLFILPKKRSTLL